jgi:hypothetical protein
MFNYVDSLPLWLTVVVGAMVMAIAYCAIVLTVAACAGGILIAMFITYTIKAVKFFRGYNK